MRADLHGKPEKSNRNAKLQIFFDSSIFLVNFGTMKFFSPFYRDNFIIDYFMFRKQLLWK